jgi:hypothetical protein
MHVTNHQTQELPTQSPRVAHQMQKYLNLIDYATLLL